MKCVKVEIGYRSTDPDRNSYLGSNYLKSTEKIIDATVIVGMIFVNGFTQRESAAEMMNLSPIEILDGDGYT